MGLLDPPVRDVQPRITGFNPPLAAGVSGTSHPTVLGLATPNSLVQLYLNGTVAGTAFADATGSWAIALPAQQNGPINLVARAAPASALQALIINDPKQPLQNVAGVPAVFEMDNERGLFYTNGVPYADLSSLVGAVSGTLSGAAISMGGFVAPDAASLLTNGTFDTATTGWTAFGSGAIAVVSGELQLTQTATGDGFSQTVTGYAGRAFTFTGTGRQGTNATNPPQLSATTQNSSLGGNTTNGAAVGPTPATAKLQLSSAGASMFLGVKCSSSTGTTLWDNFTLKETTPLQGWSTPAASSGAAAPSFSALIDAVAPAALPSSGQVKVIWQGDTNTQSNGTVTAIQRDSIRLHWASDGTVHFVVRLNNSQTFDFNLGVVAPGARFRVAFAAAAGVNGDGTTGYAASLNGANVQSQFTSATAMVGISHIRIGQEANGTAVWDGSFKRIAIVKDRQDSAWLEYQAALPTASPRVFAGDSYMGGAGGVVLPDLYETATSKVTINIGVGGSTFQQQLAYITARPYLRGLPLVIWDGSNNGMVDVASQVATAQQIWDWKGDGRILFLPSIAVPNPGTASSPTTNSSGVYLRQYRDALIAAFGAAHVYDPVPILQSLATSSTDDQNDVAAGLIPRSVLLTQNAGEVHLSTAAMTAIATHAAFQSKVAAL